MMRDLDSALVVADVGGRFPVAHDVTTLWVTVRLHGSRRLYVSGYMPREIDAWARRIEAWRDGSEPEDARLISASAGPVTSGRDVFVFFDNTDVKLRAPVDARNMARQLGVGPRAMPREILRMLTESEEPPARKKR